VPALATQEHLRELPFDGFFQAIEFFLSRNVSLVVGAAFVDRVWCGELDSALSLAELSLVTACAVGTATSRFGRPYPTEPRFPGAKLVGAAFCGIREP
jgi:hypothetical protein